MSRHDIDDDSPEPPVECPQCNGVAYLIGHLGSLAHYRCRHCGSDTAIRWSLPDSNEEMPHE